MTDYIIDSTPSKELYAPHLSSPTINPYPSQIYQTQFWRPSKKTGPRASLNIYWLPLLITHQSLFSTIINYSIVFFHQVLFWYNNFNYKLVLI